MLKVQNFLKESKQGKKQHKHVPEQHYSKVFEDRGKLAVYDALVRRETLSLTEK